jgi:hypothetical protein
MAPHLITYFNLTFYFAKKIRKEKVEERSKIINQNLYKCWGELYFAQKSNQVR